MQQGNHDSWAQRASHPAGGLSQFVVDVVAKLVARDGADEAGLREPLLRRFLEAVTAPDLRAFESIKPEFKRARISASALADHYIPEVARRLGQCWEDDSLSFAEVTMGVARLQAILRELGADWTADALGKCDGPTLLLILPQGEQHTLGAMVLAGRLRRMGVSVSVQIAPTVSELVKIVADRTFDGALISVSSESRLGACRSLVKALKDAGKGSLMVAIGGAILDDAENEMRLTGADLVTNDISHALCAMGIVVGTSPVLELS